ELVARAQRGARKRSCVDAVPWSPIAVGAVVEELSAFEGHALRDRVLAPARLDAFDSVEVAHARRDRHRKRGRWDGGGMAHLIDHRAEVVRSRARSKPRARAVL